MTTLSSSLEAFPAADLRVITARLGMGRRGLTRKSDWIEAIVHYWTTSSDRSRLLASLSPQAHDGLRRLIDYPSIPSALFVRQFGILRSVGARRKLKPSLAELTPAEELLLAGLLHSADNRSPHNTRIVSLPDDLRAILAALLPATPPPQTQAGTPCLPETVIHDVAQLLILLHAECTLRVSSKTGAPIRFTATRLRRVNRRLMRPDLPAATTLRRSQRLRWLHFWCRAAGLLDKTNHPTATASHWLELPPAQKLVLLYQGWWEASPPLRQACFLPDAVLPAPWPALFQAALARQPDTFDATGVVAALLDDRAFTGYWSAALDTVTDLEQIAAEMLAQGCTELGIVVPDAAGRYLMTALGRSLVNHTVLQWPEPAPLPAHWQSEGDGAHVLAVPASVLSPALLHLVTFVDYAGFVPVSASGAEVGGLHRYRLTRTSVQAAVRSGLTAATLFAALDELDAQPEAATAAALAAWAAPPPAIDVSLRTLVHAPTRAVMADLLDRPDLARLLGDLLSATTAAALAPPDQVRDALERAGYITGATTHMPQDSTPRRDGDMPVAAEPAALWLAGQLYSLLGSYLALPLPPPYADLDRLHASLPAGQQAALAALYERTAEALAGLLDGRVFAPSPVPTEPAQWTPILEDARDRGALLDMVYLSPARGLPTRHRIEVYWLESHRGVPYMRAYCQHAEAVRLFRLDRIQSLDYTITYSA